MAGRAAISPRQRAILEDMGIAVWTGREARPGESAPSPTTSEPPPGWEQLREAVRNCTACQLHRTRTQTVFGVGNTAARWMIVGEAPGADEDRQGEPFVGPAGKLLNEMLRAVGLSRDDVFIANILKCRPPENRNPGQEEMAACSGHLRAQITLVAPKLILAVGKIAARGLLQEDVAVARLRGRMHAYGPDAIPVVVTYHPAYLLRSPAEKRKVWDDLRFARGLVDPLPS
jgi:DNA polymerase